MPFNRLIILGFICVLIGAILPFLMVLKFVESTFWLNFIAYMTSTAGIFLGVIGVAMHVGNERGKNKRDKWFDE